MQDKIQQSIYEWVSDSFGKSEADDPSWNIEALAKHLAEDLNKKPKPNTLVYKGYRILANVNRTVFFEVEEDGIYEDIGDEVDNIKYQQFNGEDEYWYSVVGEDDWVIQSFESIDEAKEFIDSEVDND